MTYRPTQLQVRRYSLVCCQRLRLTRSHEPATNALNTAAIDAALHANDYDNAIALYNEAISVQPDAEALYCNRSAVHLATGDWQAALQDADKVRMQWRGVCTQHISLQRRPLHSRLSVPMLTPGARLRFLPEGEVWELSCQFSAAWISKTQPMARPCMNSIARNSVSGSGCWSTHRPASCLATNDQSVTPRHLSKPPRTLEDQLGLGDRW